MISVTVLIGIITLLLFPEPETNFFAYIGTMSFFIATIIFIVKRKK